MGSDDFRFISNYNPNWQRYKRRVKKNKSKDIPSIQKDKVYTLL